MQQPIILSTSSAISLSKNAPSLQGIGHDGVKSSLLREPDVPRRFVTRYIWQRDRAPVKAPSQSPYLTGGAIRPKTYPAAISASAASSVKNLATYHVGLLRERFCRLG